jgi:hypothetical protein
MHKVIGASILSLGLCVSIAGSAGAMSLAGGSAQSVDRSGIPVVQVKAQHGCAAIANPHRRHTCELQMSRGKQGTRAGRARGQHP